MQHASWHSQYCICWAGTEYLAHLWLFAQFLKIQMCLEGEPCLMSGKGLCWCLSARLRAAPDWSCAEHRLLWQSLVGSLVAASCSKLIMGLVRGCVAEQISVCWAGQLCCDFPTLLISCNDLEVGRWPVISFSLQPVWISNTESDKLSWFCLTSANMDYENCCVLMLTKRRFSAGLNERDLLQRNGRDGLQTLDQHWQVKAQCFTSLQDVLFCMSWYYGTTQYTFLLEHVTSFYNIGMALILISCLG